MNNNITWEEAVEIAIERSKQGGKYGHEEYRRLTHESHSQHLQWRAHLISKVTGVKIETKKEVIIKEQKVAISTGGGGIATIPLSDSIQLKKEINDCPNYIKDASCGCGKGWCMIGKGQPDSRFEDGRGLVSIWDCGACLRPNIEIYSINAYKKPS